MEATQKVIGKPINCVYADRRPGDPALLTSDAKKAKDLLNWEPQYTNIEDIIQTVWNLEI